MDLPEIAVLYRTRDDRGSFVLERQHGSHDHIRAQGRIDLPKTFAAGQAYIDRGMAPRTLWDWRQAEFAERALDPRSFDALASENARRYQVAEGRAPGLLPGAVRIHPRGRDSLRPAPRRGRRGRHRATRRGVHGAGTGPRIPAGRRVSGPAPEFRAFLGHPC